MLKLCKAANVCKLCDESNQNDTSSLKCTCCYRGAAMFIVTELWTYVCVHLQLTAAVFNSQLNLLLVRNPFGRQAHHFAPITPICKNTQDPQDSDSSLKISL